MSPKGKKRYVFVSHSGEDTWLALQIAREIQVRGADYFLDEANIAVGDDFEEKIRGALRRADELLVLVTPWSLKRTYVIAELGIAWFRGIPIMGVLQGLTVKDFQKLPNAPIFLKKRDIIHLNELDQYFTQLAQRVATGK